MVKEGFLACGSAEHLARNLVKVTCMVKVTSIGSFRSRDKVGMLLCAGMNVYFTIHRFGEMMEIFEKEICLSSNVFKDPLFNYFKDVPDDQWVRTTDFTPSCLIGHSSALCLELPSSLQLPKFEENFAYYNEIEGKFVLQNGSAFSRNLDLVPIVGPFSDDLPYEILFQVNLLVQNGCLPGPALDTNFYKLVDPTRINIVYIEHALEKIYYLKECCYEPSRWLNEQY
ncbi:hypothetical protein GH714_007312 [Hevea brasiliensis]|uniref:Uncharacterized protein n=1 Tax=Hevea brasiliensis TaxID=3981 RepID=A0A6A6LYN9_HEVBR|nr:hypothetical protein GH714_007312 [Hevea brasiliensis]